MADRAPVSIAFLLPHLKAGGIEAVCVNLANQIDRDRFRPSFLLKRRQGPLLERLRADIAVADLSGRRSALLPFELAAIIRQRKPDILYSGTNAMNLAALAALSLVPTRERPIAIISEHTTAATYLAGAKWPWLRRRVAGALYPAGDLFVAPTPEILAGWADELSLTPLQTAVCPNPVIPAGSVSKGGDRAPCRVVAAGRLVPDKGFDDLIEAFSSVSQSAPDAELWIFGEGPERAALEALIGQLGLGGQVHLKGYTADLLGQLARATLVVSPSRREGFGNVIVEALATAAPVLATACEGPRHILEEGAIGQLVPAEDREALGAAMIALLSDPVKRQAIAVGGPKRAGDFTIEAATGEFEAILQMLLSQRERL